ncbi:putative endopeptidase [Dysgonomonas sp. PH5-45]|uniref:M13 family metallopeptidase n=1 Tax=unclassified Dysgonomonas TaxID=2630389 RepID=UPI002476CA0F|nr:MULTISPECIES: M13 family metallopeptidase [unclassified Dysgonomonas]MDH6354663.1 putative endopeptidase [Dysgonomonas sp. PH5-45]MDH6387560.1 putative endopeptidase [Dysgonomonas sp. PH5-37]
MKKIYYFLPLALFLATANITDASAQTNGKGLDMANLDKKANPGKDFFRFATGGWADANPIPDEYSRYGSFDKLRENNQIQIKELITELGKTQHIQGSNGQKIGTLYTLGMDSVKLNKDGAAPIKSQLSKIAAIKTIDDVIRVSGEINRYASSPFFALYVSADDKNSSMNILHLYQDGLGMGTRDYYVEQDAHSRELRDGYMTLMTKQFIHAGYREMDARVAATAVMKIETALAESHYTKEKARIPEENYHKYTFEQLNSLTSNFNWTKFFAANGVSGIKELNVSQPEPIAAAVKLMQTSPIEDIKAYLAWKVINSASSYLSDDFVNTRFDFYGKQMSGSKVIQPRWKRAVSTIDGALGEEVGQMYVKKYFPAKAKERMVGLVKNLQVSLGERINGLEWMSKTTKAKAQDKLNNFIVKIGYPDKWRDTSGLKIENDSYWANIVRASEFEYNYNFSKLGKPVDKSEWHMSPQTVNAYYNPTSNEICFPAGILQPPFFYMEGDDAINYGAIGVVIGHEMTHGFDDQGRKFDKNGNMTDWWTAEDAAKFDKRAQVMVDFFDNIIVIDDLHANGKYTLGENIADHGGLQVAFNALMKTKEGKANKEIDGFTAQQRFFLAYANLWAGNVRDTEIVRLTKVDVHSLGKWRVNAALPHIDSWYKAFNITEKEPLFINKENRVSIW